MSSMDITNLTKEKLTSMFNAGKRFDGRGLLDLKDFEVEYGVSNMAEGSARVRMGKTEIIAGVKMEVGTPYPDSPNKGNLTVSADLLPLASPRFEQGPPKFNAIELPRLIDRMIRESGMIDLKKLVIVEGEKVWTVIVDIYPINDDGALVDAASIACVAALKNAVFPKLKEDGKIDYHAKSDERLPLVETTIPLTFTFYKLGDNLFLSPVREEEEACESKVTLGISKLDGRYMINSCQKGLSVPFRQEEIEKIVKLLPEKYDEVMKTFNKYLK
ncbi:hypothetical protein AUJ84_00310 [Candidatus Pacearchaeota archaeon CG1_02_32_132]|nr:MAG: hypothetical protein AUJ84_00310 [Candidatus Pacearchaeota archaeon CG1_02_32_132]